MLYVVGDSNSVSTSTKLMTQKFNVDNTTLCRNGWKTEDVLRAIRLKGNLSDATAFFVFVGMNNSDNTGEFIAANIMHIIAQLVNLSSASVPVLVAPPFCVRDATPVSLCEDRQVAAERLGDHFRNSPYHFIHPHVTKEMYAKQRLRTKKLGSQKYDPLHLNETGYMLIADAVNNFMIMKTLNTKRPPKPKVIYEAEPAPPPRVARANARKNPPRGSPRGSPPPRGSRLTMKSSPVSPPRSAYSWLPQNYVMLPHGSGRGSRLATKSSSLSPL